MRNKYALLTSLASALSLAGCGGGGAGSTSIADTITAIVTPTPSPSPSATASATPTPEPTSTLAAVPPQAGYVISPTLDGAEPLHAPFALAQGLTNTGIPENYSDTKGAFRFICGGKGRMAYVDPLVFPGESGKSHLHQSWGSDDFNASTDMDSIRRVSLTDCNNTQYSLNRSLYWMPALVNDQAEAIEPDLVAVYYKQWASTSVKCTPGSTEFAGKCVGIPNKIRFVFGWDAYNPTSKVQGATWFCSGGTTSHYSNLDDVFASGCKAGDTLTANTMGPNCWDGKYLDTPDHRSHTAFAFYDSKGRYQCPSTHPYAIPQQENKVQWTVTADMIGVRKDGTVYSRIKLSSDDALPGGKPGETLHADYMEGWVWEAKKLWFDNCIEKRLSCSAGVMGNGTKMVGAEKPVYGWLNPNPRVKIAGIR